MLGLLEGEDFNVALLHALVLCAVLVLRMRMLSEVHVAVPCSSAMFMRNWLRSSRTRRRPVSMKASKRAVNWFMRLRRSSKPKLIDGSWSAMDGASCKEARIVMLNEGSKVVMLGAFD
jgi:hypothetical protein